MLISFFVTTHSPAAARSLESTEDTEPQCRIRFIFSSVLSVNSSAAGGCKFISFYIDEHSQCEPNGSIVQVILGVSGGGTRIDYCVLLAPARLSHSDSDIKSTGFPSISIFADKTLTSLSVESFHA